MPELTQAQRNSLAILLDSREERIRAQMDAANVARTVSAGPEASDMADLAEQGAEERMDDAVVDHYRAELGDIAAARIRLARQTYGVCLDCGEPIPYPRLQAYPAAKRCTPCQRRHEHMHAGPDGRR
ncbi:TraR/DksA family transcriptional regulator [Cupriavidus basilensis]|uniref:TraR/DksA family transcriptional regulator n=1 Tax=Cupriavidus basilensis TaxID=68895 RepID=A0ABT6ANT4_9BURK|nr:TraR/DksA family transcriptional regulator [Cupriavidus basilensis]MDF3833396.1 TraR/DksA family transcriptional regulator [Cupriavidus basilensis]